MYADTANARGGRLHHRFVISVCQLDRLHDTTALVTEKWDSLQGLLDGCSRFFTTFFKLHSLTLHGTTVSIAKIGKGVFYLCLHAHKVFQPSIEFECISK
jgi:hypothetical protein